MADEVELIIRFEQSQRHWGQPEGDDPGMSDLTPCPHPFLRNIPLGNTKGTPNLKSEPTPDPFYAYPSYISKERNDLFSTFKIGKGSWQAEEWVNLMREGDIKSGKQAASKITFPREPPGIISLTYR